MFGKRDVEILSQAEIDQSLTSINSDDGDGIYLREASKPFGIEDFEKYLLDRKFEPEKSYGL
jgi:flagellar motor switch protein FliM